MQCTLNFSEHEKPAVKSFIQAFPRVETNSPFEEYRCKVRGSIVTLYSSGKVLIQGEDCEKVKEIFLDEVQVAGEIVLGIDETGRGENFGPFVIAAVMADVNAMREIRDSKKTRNVLEKLVIVEGKAMATGVAVVSAKELWEFHEKGVSMNMVEATVINCFMAFFKGIEKNIKVVVDGSPIRGVSGEASFLVRGDDKNPVVGAASILARATRENSQDKEKRKDWGKWGQKSS